MKILITAGAIIGAVTLGSGAALAQNATYCHNQATAYANQVANPAGGAVGGGIVGAVGGALAGKLLGQGKGAVAAGAALGGAGGAALGASSQKKKREQAYNEEYYRCMNTPAPAPVYYDVPPAGSPQWNYQCSLKYKSFTPSDGTYQPYRPYDGAPLPPRRICTLP